MELQINYGKIFNPQAKRSREDIESDIYHRLGNLSSEAHEALENDPSLEAQLHGLYPEMRAFDIWDDFIRSEAEYEAREFGHCDPNDDRYDEIISELSRVMKDHYWCSDIEFNGLSMIFRKD